MTTSSVLEIFPDKSHLPSINTLDPPFNFSIQPSNFFYTSLGSPSNEQVDDELPHFELKFPAPTPPEDLPQDTPPRYSIRVRSIPAHLLDNHCYNTLATLHKPHTYCEASTDSLWQIVMKEEFDTLSKNHIWDLITLPPRQSLVGYKWIYKIKTCADGSIKHYKARLITKGYT